MITVFHASISVFLCPMQICPIFRYICIIIHRRRSAATSRHYNLTRVRRTPMRSLKYYWVSRVNTWYIFTKPVINYSIILGRRQIHNWKWVNSNNLRVSKHNLYRNWIHHTKGHFYQDYNYSRKCSSCPDRRFRTNCQTKETTYLCKTSHFRIEKELWGTGGQAAWPK